MSERAARGMAGIGGAVAVASALSPRAFLRVFGVAGACSPPEPRT